MKRADAHIHFFPRGYSRPGAPALFGENELQVYEALRVHHDIDLALAIAYEGEGGDPDNNAYVRGLAGSHGWLKTLAFFAVSPAPERSAIERALEAGHSGLAIYAVDRASAEGVLSWPEGVWRILETRGA